MFKDLKTRQQILEDRTIINDLFGTDNKKYRAEVRIKGAAQVKIDWSVKNELTKSIAGRNVEDVNLGVEVIELDDVSFKKIYVLYGETMDDAREKLDLIKKGAFEDNNYEYRDMTIKEWEVEDLSRETRYVEENFNKPHLNKYFDGDYLKLYIWFNAVRNGKYDGGGLHYRVKLSPTLKKEMGYATERLTREQLEFIKGDKITEVDTKVLNAFENDEVMSKLWLKNYNTEANVYTTGTVNSSPVYRENTQMERNYKILISHWDADVAVMAGVIKENQKEEFERQPGDIDHKELLENYKVFIAKHTQEIVKKATGADNVKVWITLSNSWYNRKSDISVRITEEGTQ